MLKLLSVITWMSSLSIIFMIQPLTGGVTWEISPANMSVSQSMYVTSIILIITSLIILLFQSKKFSVQNKIYKTLYGLLLFFNLFVIAAIIACGGPQYMFTGGTFDVYGMPPYLYQVMKVSITMYFIIMFISLYRKSKSN